MTRMTRILFLVVWCPPVAALRSPAAALRFQAAAHRFQVAAHRSLAAARFVAQPVLGVAQLLNPCHPCLKNLFPPLPLYLQEYGRLRSLRSVFLYNCPDGWR